MYYRSIDALISGYHACLKEKQPVIICDIDKTAIKKRGATEIGTELLFDSVGSFLKGFPGAIKTLYNLKVRGSETDAFLVFRDTLEEAEVTPKELKQYAQKVVDKAINPSFIRTMSEIQDAYKEIRAKNDYQKPLLMLKTTGLDVVPAAVYHYLKQSSEFEPGIDQSFDAWIIGNPYKPDIIFDTKTVLLSYNNSDRMPIKEENQVGIIDNWLKDNTGSGLENAIVIDDRNTFANISWAFIASNLAKKEVKNAADYVMQ